MSQPLTIEENPSTLDDRHFLDIWARKSQFSIKYLSRTFIYSLYDSFIFLYPPQDIEKRIRLKNMKQIIIYYALETTMFISFLHYDSMEIKDWSTYAQVWIGISFLRADKILTFSGMFHVWQALANGMIYIPMAGVAYLTMLGIYKKPLRFKYAKLLIKIPIFVTTGILIGPISSGLYSLIKYRSYENAYSIELGAQVEILNPSFGACAAVGLTVYIGFCVLVKKLSIEIRHDIAHLDAWGMASTNQEVLKVLWSFFLVFSYYFILSNIYWVHYIIISVSSGILSYKYFKRLPFYNPLMNKLHAMQLSAVSFVSFSHLVGYYMDSSTVILAMSFIITTILVLYIAFAFYDYAGSIVEDIKSRFYSIDCIEEFELAIRDVLINGDESAVELFSEIYDHERLKNHKLLYILDSYFTYATLNQKQLARVKLSFIHLGKSSFEYDYQEYRCRLFIENETESDSLKYMKYSSSIQSAKNEDEILCKDLIDLWEQLFSALPNHTKIRQLVKSIHNRRAKLRKSYLSLVKTYPKIPYINDLLGSLIVDICNNPSKGYKFMQRAAFQREDTLRIVGTNKLSFFNPEAGVIVVSCDPNYFARVVYANSQAIDILGYSHKVLIGSSLTNLIPYPYSEIHCMNIKRFMINRNINSIEIHPKVLFFTNSDIRMVPVLCNIQVDVLGSHPCFLVSFLRYEKSPNMALINDDGVILSHTECFNTHIEERSENLIGFNLYSIFPVLKDRFFKPFSLLNDRNIIIVRLPVGHHTLNIAIIYKFFTEVEDFYIPDNWSHQFKQSIGDDASITTETSPSVEVFSFSQAEVGCTDTGIRFDVSNYDLSQISAKLRKLNYIQEPQNEGEIRIQISEKKSLTYSSVNSSFKSKIKSGQLLSKINTVHEASRSLRNCLIITMVGIFGLIIGISVFLDQTLEQMYKNSDLNTEISKGLFYLQVMTSGARTLNLIEEYQENLPTTLTDLQTAIQTIQKLTKSFDNYIKLIESDSQDFYKDLIYDSRIITYSLQGTNIHSTTENLMNIFYEFSYSTQTLMNKTESESIQSSDPALFYLLANANGPAYSALNSTYTSILDFQNSNMELVRIYFLISFSSIGIVIFICFFFIAHRLYVLQKSSNIVWDMIYAIPIDTLLELKRRAVERLLNVHDVVLEPTNEMIFNE
jgi:hypothetical protein